MWDYQFTFNRKVVPKQSARMGKFGVYQTKEIKNYEKALQWELKSQLKKPFKLIDNPIRVKVIAYFKPIKSLKKIEKEAINLGSSTIYKETKPDIEQITKGLYDAMEGIVFTNDSRIVDSRVIKQYGVSEKIEVFIKVL